MRMDGQPQVHEKATEHELEVYSYGKCMWFAVAAHDKTGWPIEVLRGRNGEIDHAWVRMPTGQTFDVAGINGADDMIQFDPLAVERVSRDSLMALSSECGDEVRKAARVLDRVGIPAIESVDNALPAPGM
jgi:hypothetical protein